MAVTIATVPQVTERGYGALAGLDDRYDDWRNNSNRFNNGGHWLTGCFLSLTVN